MLFIVKLILTIILAVGGTLLGNKWIAGLYAQKREILTFPHKVQEQNRQRHRFLPAILGVFFALYLLSTSAEVLTTFFMLFYIYFLVIFSVTDFEQQVIFDNMLIPFTLMGLSYSFLSDAGFFNHLTAALGGGALFLILAILTKGGIGGGDIKLIAALGLWLGISSLTHVIAVGFIGGGIAALFLLLSGQKKRTDTFAYGPYFAIAALIVLLL